MTGIVVGTDTGQEEFMVDGVIDQYTIEFSESQVRILYEKNVF